MNETVIQLDVPFGAVRALQLVQLRAEALGWKLTRSRAGGPEFTVAARSGHLEMDPLVRVGDDSGGASQAVTLILVTRPGEQTSPATYLGPLRDVLVAEGAIPTSDSEDVGGSEHDAPRRIDVKGHSGRVQLDEEFVTIIRTRFVGRALVGKGEKRIPISQITAVQFKPAGPLISGFISFTVGGGNERRSRFGHQTVDAGRDENSVIFTYRQCKEFENLRAAVERAIADRHRPVAAAALVAPVAPAPGIPQQIAELAQLRDAGVLTNEEFEAKKAELLARM